MPEDFVILALLTSVAAFIGGLVTLYLAVDFWRDEAGALKRSTHRREKLGQVMVGRYAAFCILAVAAAIYGDPLVILVLFSVFSGVSFYDAWLYRRDGQPFAPHLAAGLACWVTMGLALVQALMV